MRWKPLGRTWIRKRRMNSSMASVITLARSRPSARESFHLKVTPASSKVTSRPFEMAQRCEIGGEGAAPVEVGVIGEELQAAGGMKGGELFQEQATKQPREHADGEEEAGPA